MNVIQITGYILMLSVFSGCSTETLNDQISTENVVRVETEPTMRQEKQGIDSIKNTIGLVVLSDHYGKDDFVRLYNADGSLWYEFTYYYDDSDGKFEYENEDFGPFAFHQDYFILALKCVGEDDKRYEVIVNEDTGLKKFIRKNDRTVRLETWEKHIKGLFAVDFNKEVNPLRDKPEGRIKIIEIPEDTIFHPVEIRGDWLKVRLDSPEVVKKNTEFAWIKWKENDVIIIELFYIS